MTLSPDNWCPPPPQPTQQFVDSPPNNRGIQGNRAQFEATLDAALSAGLQPVRIEGAILEQLRKLFQVENHCNAELADLIWKPGTATGIQIDSYGTLTEPLTGKRPAIFVKRNKMNYLPLFLYDLSGRTTNNEPIFTEGWVGSHTVFCISSPRLSAEYISCFVRAQLGRFCRILREHMNLLKLQVVDVDVCSELEEAKETYVVPVTVGWAFQDNYLIEEEVPLMRDIAIAPTLR